jgi:hypothetical protein
MLQEGAAAVPERLAKLNAEVGNKLTKYLRRPKLKSLVNMAAGDRFLPQLPSKGDVHAGPLSRVSFSSKQ